MSFDKKRRLNNEDRRVKRTKKALKDAFLTLLEQKTVDQISVTELTNLAQVNRATFYFYYTDILDMLQQIQNEAYQLFENAVTESDHKINSVENFTAYAEMILTICKENEAVVRFIIKNDTNNRLYTQIRHLMMLNIPDSKATFELTNPARYTTNFLLTAIVGIIIDWMDEGMVIHPREMAEFLANLYLNGSFKTRQIYTE